MLTIATLLDPISDQAVRVLWTYLEQSCGLTGVQDVPVPHFSWQGAEAYPMAQLETLLTRMAREITPFRARAAGLGIFTGVKPVVYIPLVKDEKLLTLHKLLWEETQPLMVGPNPYYHPELWVPHITLALHEVDAWRLACAVEEMATQKIEFEVLVNNLTVLFQLDGKSGMKSRFDFNKDVVQYGPL